MRGLRLVKALGLGVLGLAYGGGVGIMAVSLGGGGHGWTSASFSTVAVILVPAFGVAMALPRRGRTVALMLIAVGMLLTDSFLVLATWEEGVPYLTKVLTLAPVGVLLWAVLWTAWQLAVLLAIARDVREWTAPRRCKR